MSTILDPKIIVKPVVEEPITLKDKMHLVANALRNNIGVEQLYCELDDGKGGMCAFGLLAFRAGIPHDENDYNSMGYHEILELYGISKEESMTVLKFNRELTGDDTFEGKHVLSGLCYERDVRRANTYLSRGVYNVTLDNLQRLNDCHIKFNTIADVIDYTADTL